MPGFYEKPRTSARRFEVEDLARALPTNTATIHKPAGMRATGAVPVANSSRASISATRRSAIDWNRRPGSFRRHRATIRSISGGAFDGPVHVQDSP